jgi:hypothetical protein
LLQLAHEAVHGVAAPKNQLSYQLCLCFALPTTPKTLSLVYMLAQPVGTDGMQQPPASCLPVGSDRMQQQQQQPSSYAAC